MVGVILSVAVALVCATALFPPPLARAEQPLAVGFTYSPRQSAYLGLPWRETYRAALGLGAPLVRLGTYWDELEPRPGTYRFGRLDWLLDQAEAGGARVILTVGMKAPRWPEYFLPPWLARELDVQPGGEVSRDPELRAHALRFIEQVVARYAHRAVIAAWQVENEPLDPAGPRQWRIGAEFLEREIALVRRLDPRRRPVVVNLFVPIDPRALVLPPDGRAGTILRSADVLGLDVYPRRGLRVLGRDLYPDSGGWAWERVLRPYARLAAERGKQAWIIEAQAEPWEPGLLVYTAAAPSPSLGPGQMATIAGRLGAAGFERILLWGVEHWYMRKLAHGDPSWWEAGARLLAAPRVGAPP